MTETKLLTMVQNCHGYLQGKYMGKTCSFLSQCGPIMMKTCRLVTNPVTWWVLTHFMTIPFQRSFLKMMMNYLT